MGSVERSDAGIDCSFANRTGTSDHLGSFMKQSVIAREHRFWHAALEATAAAGTVFLQVFNLSFACSIRRVGHSNSQRSLRDVLQSQQR